MKRIAILAAGLAALAAGCASFDGRGLEPGRARQADVEAVMGQPAQRLSRSDGGTDLYYSRLPAGRRMYVARIGPDGVLRGIEQRLTFEHIKRVAPNVSTAKEVRELLGPPYRVVRMPRQNFDSWEYPWLDAEDRRMLWVNFSADGVVREVIEMHDYESDPPSSGGDKD
jgi:hypothetical protein